MSSAALSTVAPDSPELADTAAAWRSAYVHIPFCRRRCPYCDFAVVTPEEGGTAPTVDRYVAAVAAEIAGAEPWRPLDAVNFGGGTPSSTAPGDITRLIRALRDRFGLAGAAEVSLEANPEDWSDEIGAAYLDGGVTRVTLGVQSLDDGVLGSLGRVHVGEQAVSAVASARRSGVPSVGIDLMYGAPGESLDSWRATVTKALALGVDHVSAYALTVEPGTALASAVTAGAPGPDPDDQADKYELFDALAAGAGLIRYEVSNWARPGHVCRYNLSTWAQGEYAAFGLGAHGHRGGRRTRNARVLDVYLDRVESASSPQVAVEEVAGWSREQERLMVGLRRAAGVVAGWGGEILAGSEEGKRLIAAGVLELRAGRLVVSRPLLTDEVVRAVLALKEPQGGGRAWLSLSPRDC